ncbi:MAG: ABC transporter permease subunit [Flavobacteriaceae bacterium]
MLRLLQIEYIKLKNSKASKILIITYFVLLTSISLISLVKFDYSWFQLDVAKQGIFNFPYIWHFNSWFMGWFKIFLLLVVVSMVTTEYSNKTLKQNLIDGLSKKEFILSKFLTVTVFALLSTVFLFLISLIQGFMFSDITEFKLVFSDLEYLLAFFVKLVGFFSFGLFLGVLVKRSAFALGALGVWAIIESISYAVMRWQLFPKTDVYKQVSQFFPLQAISNLIEQPITRFKAVKSLAKQGNATEILNFDYAIHWYQIAIVLVWIFIFIFGAYKLILKRDL